MAAMPLPPLNLNSNASSRSGDIYSSFGPIKNGININYGEGGISVGDVPKWVWVAAGAAAVLWLKRKG